MSELVNYELKNGVATLTMQNGKVNAISPDMIAALGAALDQAEADKASVILTGQPGIFSAGFDLKVMQSGDANAVVNMVAGGRDIGLRLRRFPAPVIMAVSGHAMAMGFVFLTCGDYNIAPDADIKMGLNEVAIGMTMPIFGVELARARMAPHMAQRVVNQGEILTPATALDCGLIDEVVAPEKLLARAQEKSEQLNDYVKRPAFVATRNKFNDAMIESIKDVNDFNPFA